MKRQRLPRSAQKSSYLWKLGFWKGSFFEFCNTIFFAIKLKTLLHCNYLVGLSLVGTDFQRSVITISIPSSKTKQATSALLIIGLSISHFPAPHIFFGENWLRDLAWIVP